MMLENWMYEPAVLQVRGRPYSSSLVDEEGGRDESAGASED